MSTIDDAKQAIAAIQAQPGWVVPQAHGLGIARINVEDRQVLDVWYPNPNLNSNNGVAALLSDRVGLVGVGGAKQFESSHLQFVHGVLAPFAEDGGAHPNLEVIDQLKDHPVERECDMPGTAKILIYTQIMDLEQPPTDAYDAYLRLHLLSHRLVRPHGCNLEGIFGLLANVVWTNMGPALANGFDKSRLQLVAKGINLTIYGVDKFPRMVDYVVPSGVRIADADRVRLGAHLAEGTTIMHEGFANFNAGTLGASMVEGRISAGVVVGDGSDIGGGASIMGTLSGGGEEVISIGRGCLLGANGGTGISLGDNCVVEAGLYLTAGTKVRMPDEGLSTARSLSGISNALFRRNSTTGEVEMLAHDGEPTWGGLSDELHTN